MRFVRVGALLLLLATTATAQEGWKDERGRPVPNTDSRKSLNGFGGWLLVTPDADWRAKWETPSTTTPRFNEAKAVSRGKKVFVLTFFANPRLDSARSADVSCDIEIRRPNGTASTHKGAVCFKGSPAGDPRNMYLCAPVIEFVGEPKDPAGEWVVQITVRDNIGQVSLPLKTSFVLEDSR